MIAVAVVGIVAAVAIPAYEKHVYRTKAAKVILVLDKIRAALAGLEAETGKSIGKDILIRTDAFTGQQEILYTIRSSNQTGSISGLANADLNLKGLGVAMGVLSGWAPANQAGQYQITLAWSVSNPGVTTTQQQARQLVLATHDVMQARAYKSQIGSSFATLNFSLHEPGP
jgi:Tfp pilus assembly major pilin PilA